MAKPILCLDFDGVINSYTSGWKGADAIPDPVTPGFFEWALAAAEAFRLVIFSSRSRQPGGIDAMRNWLRLEWQASPLALLGRQMPEFEFADEKPPAMLTIDDRGLTFDGDWSHYDAATLLAFKPWNK